MSKKQSPRDREKTDWRFRIFIAVSGAIGIVGGYTLLYWLMVGHYAQSISIVQALQVVIEALTTAGFGGDTDLWREHDPLAALVILMNLSGVLFVFLAIPLFGVPLIRDALSTTPPTITTLENHVVICGYSVQDEVLTEELEAAEIPYLFVERDRQQAQELEEAGFDVIHGNAERTDTLHAANVEDARAVVADIDDETNPTLILSARSVNPDVKIISVVRDHEIGSYHRYAGADEVISNRKLLGRSLGMRATGSFAEQLRETIAVEEDVEVTELRVQEDSELIGQTIEEANIRDRIGVVVGVWVGGKFLIAPEPDTEIQEHTILLVIGEHGEPEGIKTQAIPDHREDNSRVVVCGYGSVGRWVTDTVRLEDHEAITIDIEDKPGVDVVGDITEPRTFSDADVDDSRSVVISIDDEEDVTTLFTILVINKVAPGVEIVARADDADSVRQLYNAGADFVISLPTVTGEMLAQHIIEDADILTPDVDFEFLRCPVSQLAGQTLAELDVRNETGCTVIGVERDGEFLTEIGPEFTVDTDDVFVVAGTESARSRFESWVTEVASE